MASTANTEPLAVKRDSKGKIYSPIRKMWLHETPEECVRQDYLVVLLNEYGFSLDQIGEEVPVTERGAGNARADFLVWRTPQDKADKKHPLG
jgi:type I restriction enzyme M protein